ncbi:phenylacetate--CoA ligase family protein [Bacillus horti]|uniref:Phenylacetate-coenzyme A ligase PaaK-like adenylate-forming protein n=1 Tax=Caldalkalibacillus horti TaxID=77523 RepID=A0ABT9W1T2_9BACI|nr:phenylacetate--CoA ligase family protein [Bacillus horti]MDQ0167193.1 phenylacetate-coenzyme A ligase PaaK-like adenylate-forming protein [Bacillus horti]
MLKPLGETNDIIHLDKLKTVDSLIQFSRQNSSFYSGKFGGCPYVFSTYDDFRSVPFTTSQDLINKIPPYDMLTDSTEEAYVFTSGGTSGQPKLIFITADELKKNIAYHGYGYRRAGITSQDIVGTFGIPGYLTSEFTVYLGLEHTKCMIVPLGIYSDPEKLLYYIRLFNVTTLLVMPSDIIPFIQYLEQTGETLNIAKMIYGGEKMYPSTQQYIQRVLHVQHFGAVYQSMDVGTIGYQCECSEAGEYHIHEDLLFAEFLDDDGSLIGVGEQGELVVTNLNRRLMPVIRYKTNDRVQLLGRGCQCGDRNVKISLLGRKGEYFKIGGEQFTLKAIQNLIERLEGSTGVFQIEITKRDRRDHILLKIEEAGLWKASKLEKESYKQTILHELAKEIPKLMDMQLKGVIHPTDIMFTSRKGLVVSESSGKVIQVCDFRE